MRAGMVFARMLIWRVSVRWYLISVFPIPVVASAIIALCAFTDGLATYPQHLAVLASAALMRIVIVAGEEIWWRGHTQPRRQARHHPLVAGAIISLFWRLWYVWGPTHGPGSNKDVVDIQVLVGGTISASVVQIWL